MPFLVPITVCGAILSMLLPVHPRVLDILLIINVLFACFLLLSALALTGSLKLSSLPTALVLGTLFRLSLNVSSTRLILLGGSPGKVIEACGSLVIGNELLVGVVIFLVITIVQFMVIAKGSERVAEVSARFTLDALPGKQMSIDADVRAGLIDGTTAREKREEIALESRFYAALDGAMKFIKGDAIAAMLIVGINLIGGCISGLTRGMPLLQIMHHYSLLSIGDGLVSQIPALMNSLAASTVVTRVTKSDGGEIGRDIISQICGSPARLIVVGVVVLVGAWLPQMPTTILMCIGLALLLGGSIKASQSKRQLLPTSALYERPTCVLPPTLELLARNQELFTRAFHSSEVFSRMFSEEIFKRWGVLLHEVVTRISPEEMEKDFALKLHGVTIGESHFSERHSSIESIVEIADRVVAELIDEQSIRHTIEYLEPQLADTLTQFLASEVTYTQMALVCRELVQHRFTIKPIVQILQALSEAGVSKKTPSEITEHVRLRIRRQLCFEGSDKGSVLNAVTLAVGLERSLHKKIEEQSSSIAIVFFELAMIIDRESKKHSGHTIVVVSAMLRKLLADTFYNKNILLKVLSYEELVAEMNVQEIKRISHEDFIKDAHTLAA